MAGVVGCVMNGLDRGEAHHEHQKPTEQQDGEGGRMGAGSGSGKRKRRLCVHDDFRLERKKPWEAERNPARHEGSCHRAIPAHRGSASLLRAGLRTREGYPGYRPIAFPRDGRSGIVMGFDSLTVAGAVPALRDERFIRRTGFPFNPNAAKTARHPKSRSAAL